MVNYKVVTETISGKLNTAIIDMPKEFNITKHVDGVDDSLDTLFWNKIEEKITFDEFYTLKSIEELKDEEE